MTPLLRVLVVANTDWFIANFMLRFLEEHAQRGVVVDVASPAGRHVDSLQEAGFAWHRIPMVRGRGGVGDALATVGGIRDVMREAHPDLVHLVTSKAVLLGEAAAGSSAAAIVHVLPGLGHAFASRSPLSLADRAVLLAGMRRVSRRPRRLAVFHQAADRETILGSSESAWRRSRIIPGWGVDLERFRVPPAELDPPLVVMISRMLWTKGVGEFVAAAEIVRRSRPARFVLVGSPDPGNPGSVGEARSRAWQESGTIEWWGHREDVPQILASATVCVLPSKYGEGVPQSLIEAAAAGVPMVATDISGLPRRGRPRGDRTAGAPGQLGRARLGNRSSVGRPGGEGAVGRPRSRARRGCVWYPSATSGVRAGLPGSWIRAPRRCLGVERPGGSAAGKSARIDPPL